MIRSRPFLRDKAPLDSVRRSGHDGLSRRQQPSLCRGALFESVETGLQNDLELRVLLADVESGLTQLMLVGFDIAPEQAGAAEYAGPPGGQVDDLEAAGRALVFGFGERPGEVLELLPIEDQVADQAEVGQADVVLE